MSGLLASLAEKLFYSTLEAWSGGALEVVTADGRRRFGDPRGPLQARIDVHHGRFFRRALTGGDTAIGEAYMDGDWSSPDLVSLIRLGARNLARLEESHAWLSALSRAVDTLRHRLRDNTPAGSRRNIQAHYDLSNAFFRLFLDASMAYSCAWYGTENDSLETAQINKFDRICRKLDLRPGDHLLEIGTGWGGFALYAATRYGCRVTTTTISREQHDHARAWFAAAGAGSRITLLLEDYRRLKGRFDKIASIEMFEAVGFEHYDAFFGACDRLLAPDGAMLLQTITMNEQRFARYRRQSDWIQKYIFPGAELASLRGILDSLARATRLSLFHAEDMGAHYARTLAEWRRRFHAASGEVKALGFDDRFLRMWDYYLAFCEGAFLERHISDQQLLLTKNYNPRPLFQEPWRTIKASEPQECVASLAAR